MQGSVLQRLALQQLGALTCCLQQQQSTWPTLLLSKQLLSYSSPQASSAAALPTVQQPFDVIIRPFSSTARQMSTSSSIAEASSASSTATSTQQRPSLQEIRARIFEHHIGDGRRSGRKAILRPLKGRHIANWYFTLTSNKMPMLEDEIEEERVLKVQLARATGSGPPKKGQGKRAGKKR